MSENDRTPHAADTAAPAKPVDGGIDLAALASVAGATMQFFPAAAAPAGDVAEVESVPPVAPVVTQKPAETGSQELVSHLEELADDTLHLMQRVQALEARQVEAANRMEELTRAVTGGMRVCVQDIGGLRQLIENEARASAATTAAAAMLPSVESLKVIRDGLPADADEAVRNQIFATLLSLEGSLRGFGLRPFDAAVGEAFDPGRMECVGYGKGAPGVVLDVTRQGYAFKDRVVRPAGVIIADPKAAAAAEPEDEPAETP